MKFNFYINLIIIILIYHIRPKRFNIFKKTLNHFRYELITFALKTNPESKSFLIITLNIFQSSAFSYSIVFVFKKFLSQITQMSADLLLKLTVRFILLNEVTHFCHSELTERSGVK